MERTIKFRGKRIDNGEWVYGDFIHGVGMHYGNSYILPNQQWLPTDCDPLDGYHVASDTIDQFTELTDKNGKEIFEGDIIEFAFENGHTSVEYVSFKNGRFVTIDPKKPYRDEALCVFVKYVSVLGNIYDNIEMLKR